MTVALYIHREAHATAPIEEEEEEYEGRFNQWESRTNEWLSIRIIGRAVW